MLIFGFTTKVFQLAMLNLICTFCGNPAAQALRRRVTKFTLFFVPLFPFSTKYATQCTFCGGERQIPKEQADGLLAQAQGGQDANPYGAAPQQQPGYAPPGGQNPYQN